MNTIILKPSQHVTIDPRILYFGTPVVLISTRNEDDTVNLAPMSSAWALGKSIVLGFGTGGQTAQNLDRTGECVLNLPSDDLWSAVERLAPLTGAAPVPLRKLAQGFHHQRDKFGAAGLTPIASELVSPPGVAECPLCLEARVEGVHSLHDEETGAIAVEVRVIRVHAHPGIVIDDHHIDPAAWHPLIYNFRHYFGLGPELGKTFRAET